MAEDPSKAFFATPTAQTPAGAVHGEITGGVYTGPKLPGHSPIMSWKCPACATEQISNPDEGCPSCGSGTAKAFVKADPIAPPGRPPQGHTRPLVDHPAVPDVPIAESEMTREWQLSPAFEQWWATIDSSRIGPYDVARAAWTAGYEEALRRTMTAAPVTTDTAALAPEGRMRRTIIAALEHFLAILETDPEEVAAGEWLTLAEVKDLIQQLQQQEEAENARE